MICYRCPWRSFVDHWLMRFINSLIHGYTRLSICLHVWFVKCNLFCIVRLSISMVLVLFPIIPQVVLWSRTCRHYNYGYVIPVWLLQITVGHGMLNSLVHHNLDRRTWPFFLSANSPYWVSCKRQLLWKISKIIK